MCIVILQLARIDYENAQFDETNYNELAQRDVFGKKGPHSKPAAVLLEKSFFFTLVLRFRLFLHIFATF